MLPGGIPEKVDNPERPSPGRTPKSTNSFLIQQTSVKRVCKPWINTGIPLKPMLAKICEGIPDALRQLQGSFLAEFKYDGQRSQIHLLPDNSVKLFSRNCAPPAQLTVFLHCIPLIVHPGLFVIFLNYSEWSDEQKNPLGC